MPCLDVGYPQGVPLQNFPVWGVTPHQFANGILKFKAGYKAD